MALRIAVLERRAYLPHCTIGTLSIGHLSLWTIERPWQNNDPADDGDDLISCIPEGSYLCRRTKSPRFGECFTVTGVPMRSHILFHAGNTVSDVVGCIALGRNLNTSAYGVTQSKLAVDDFMSELAGVDEFMLHIRQCRQDYS